MARRRWIKLWAQELLYGSTTAELLPEERWVWVGLLAMAGDSIEQGTIIAAPNVPWTKEQIAQILKVPLSVLESALQKMQVIPSGQTHAKINMNGSGVIRIMNWEKYQSDWDRIRKYPSQKPTEKPTPDKPTEKPTTITEGRGGEGKGTEDKKGLTTIKEAEGSFEVYLIHLKEEFKDIDIDSALEEFNLYNSEVRKKPLKSRKLAFRNWLANCRNYGKNLRDKEWRMR